jgi:hypothetical protein
MAIEIIDLPINSMVDLSIVFCKRLPEGIGFMVPESSTCNDQD